MNLSSRIRSRLGEGLSLSAKLRAKRLFVGSVRLALRLVSRLLNYKDRIIELAVTQGLDPDEAWTTRVAPRPAALAPWGVRDFLFVVEALKRGAHEAGASDAAPRVSIIISAHDEIEHTFQCLRSLIAEVDFADTEIVIVNNASRDETAQVLSYFEDFVRIIHNVENVGPVEALNQGAREARGRYLVFLDNDTIVQAGWLEHLLDTCETGARIGAVGSMLIRPDGLLQEAGAIIWRDAGSLSYGAGRSPDEKRFNFAREVDYCSAASLLIRRELFEQLGGFDRLYASADYADADLCFGVRSLGHRVVYQPMSRAVQLRDAAPSNDAESSSERLAAVSRAKFREKWREMLEREQLASDPSLTERAANRRRGPGIIVFDDHIPTPDRDAGSARMLFILRSLAAWSRPVFVSLGKPVWPDYERLLWKEGVETASAADYLRLVKERDFIAAIISRPLVAEAVIPTLRRIRGGAGSRRIPVVFDMVDVHFIRYEREHQLTGDAEAGRQARAFRALEARVARMSDLLWCVSPDEKALMEREAPGVPAVVIPTIHHLHARGPAFDERRDLLFVGNFRHRPNSDGVIFFLREIYPRVRESLPETRFFIVGDGAPPEIQAYDSEAVRVLGYVPDIAPLFERCRVFVAPIRFGAGVKGKIGEALSYGVPVVTTTIGAEGMGFVDGREVLIADDPAEFTSAVVRAYRERELWQSLSDNGYAHIERQFSPQVVGEAVNTSIKGLGAGSLTGAEG